MSAWIIVLSIIAGLLLVVLFLLLFPILLNIHMELTFLKRVSCKIHLRFLGGLFSYKTQLGMNFLDDPPLQLIQTDRKRERLLWKPGLQKKEKTTPFPIAAVWEKIETKCLIIKGECGVRDDAAVAALLAGSVMAAFHIAWSYLHRQKACAPPEIRFRAVTEKDCFWLNLEWIGTCKPVHIITAIILWRKNVRKERVKAWHTQSKTF